jgi:hypothetical protein
VTRAGTRAARRALGAGALLALLAPGAPAGAHTSSLSYSAWEETAQGARVQVRVSQLDLSRLGLAFAEPGSGVDPIGRYLEAHLHVSVAGRRCEADAPPLALEAETGWAVRSWRVTCAGTGPRAVESSILLEAAPSHLHFARLRTAGGRIVDRVLSEAEPRWEWPAPEAPGPAREPARGGGTSLAGYARLGIEHILTGWDHLAFVLALLLLAGTLGEVAALVTSFTVAHSVTLAIATLGLVHPDTAAVEALIGFSIALVAAENAWILAGRGRVVPLAVAAGLGLLALAPHSAVAPAGLAGLALFSLCHFALLDRSSRPARLRVAVAFAFGLVHGFGFAGVLAELALPRAQLAAALFGFNAGVELGQLAVLALVWPCLRALARPAGGRALALVAEAGSAAICGLGLYWFLVRALG